MNDELAAAIDRVRRRSAGEELPSDDDYHGATDHTQDLRMIGEAALDSPASLPGVQALVEAAVADMRERAANILDYRHRFYQSLALRHGYGTDSDFYMADQWAQEDANAIRSLPLQQPDPTTKETQ